MSAYSLGSLLFFDLSVTAIEHGLPGEMLYECSEVQDRISQQTLKPQVC